MKGEIKKMIQFVPVAVIALAASIIFLIVCLTYEAPPKVGDVYMDYYTKDIWSAPSRERASVVIMTVLEVNKDKVKVAIHTLWEDGGFTTGEQWMPQTFLTIGTVKKLKEGVAKEPDR